MKGVCWNTLICVFLIEFTTNKEGATVLVAPFTFGGKTILNKEHGNGKWSVSWAWVMTGLKHWTVMSTAVKLPNRLSLSEIWEIDRPAEVCFYGALQNLLAPIYNRFLSSDCSELASVVGVKRKIKYCSAPATNSGSTIRRFCLVFKLAGGAEKRLITNSENFVLAHFSLR